MPTSADKKPEKYTKPDGKIGIRMVPVMKDIDEISLDDLKKSVKTAGNYKKVAKAHGSDKLKKDLAMLRKGLVKESPEDNEPASPDEKSMAMRQAKFIQYVGEEIMEHLEQDNDFPEWMQNKLSALHQKAKDMHATMAGDYEDDEDEEEMNEDIRKLSHSRLKFHATKNVPHGSYTRSEIEDEHERRKRTAGAEYAKAKPTMNESYINEKLSVSDGMGAWIDDFKKSDAPQFKGKSDKERRDMAIAAYLSAKRGAKNEAMTASQHRMAMLDKIKKSGAVKQGSMSKNETVNEEKWLVTWKQKNTGNDSRKYMDSSQFHTTEREARLHKGKLKNDPRVLRNSPTMKKVKEETKLDEVLDSPEKLDRYKAKAKDSRDRAAKSAVATNLRSKDKPQREHPAKDLKTMAKRTAGLKMADRAAMRKTYKALRKEEVEQLDELSPKTLTSYAKASYNDVLKRRANRPAGQGDESDPKIGKRLAMNKLAHKKGAFKEEAEIDEGIFTKKPKINIGKLHDFHAYHEKKSEAHASAQKKYDSNSRMADHHSEQGYEHQNAADHLHNASKAHDKGDHKAVAKHLALYHKTSVARKGIKEEVEIEEAAPKMKGDSFKQERERARQHDAAMGRTPTGRKKPVRKMTSTQRSLASLRKEEVELDERFTRIDYKKHGKTFDDLRKKAQDSIDKEIKNNPKYKSSKKEEAKPDAAEVMRKKQQMKNISTSDKDKLAKIRTMLNKEKK